MKSSRWATLVSLITVAACRDATVIAGHVHVVKPDTGGALAAPEAGASGAPATQGVQPVQPLQTAYPKQAMQLRQPRAPLTIEPGTRDQFCAGHGGAVKRGACTPIEREIFRYAVCTCGDLRFEGESFSSDAYDSTKGAYAPGQGGAAIGVNGSFFPLAQDVQLGGSLTVTGAAALTVASRMFSVRGDLKSSAPFQAATSGVRVARDAWFGADVMGLPGSIYVGRDGYLKLGAMGAEALQSRVRAANFTLTPPCPCDQASGLDVPAIVAMAQASADNAAAGYSKDSLKDIFATWDFPLPCGRFVLSEISIRLSTLSITVSGRTSLFVEGDMTLIGTNALVINPGAELDLFIAGNLTLMGTNAIAVTSQPSALRIYVGGSVSVAPSIGFSAALYAPRAQFADTLADSNGAIVVDSLSETDKLKFHYDRDILNTAPACSSAGHACDSCEQCAGGLACVAGTCGACQDDSDCCEPFGCVSGRCGPLDVPAP